MSTRRNIVLRIVFVSVAIVVLPIGNSVLAERLSDRSYVVRVLKIVDGDSLIVLHDNKKMSVRLWGIDAPEYNQPYSNLGKKHLQNTIGGGRIHITPVDVDKYGRVVALVGFRGENINEQMIGKGYAWVHIYFCHEEICSYWRQLEAEAKKKKIGLWREASPVPPWKWKKRK